MALRIIWSTEAEETFDSIIEYLENNWSEKSTRRFIHKSQDIFSQIIHNPYMFKASNFQEIRKAVITKHISLFYFVNKPEGIIELYSFWDNRQNPNKSKF